MPEPATSSLFDELRLQYETARTSPHQHEDVEGYQQIDARLHKAYAWLEKAMAYLDELKPPIEHRFDLGHGLVLEAPRFNRGYVGQHTQRIVGYPVIDEINIWYEIATAKPLTIEVAQGGVALAEKALDEAGLQYSARRVVDHNGIVTKCVITVPPMVPSAVMFKTDYQTGLITCAMTNVDRFDRVTLEFHSNAIDTPILDDLLHFILGRNANFLRRAPLAGIHGQPRP